MKPQGGTVKSVKLIVGLMLGAMILAEGTALNDSVLNLTGVNVSVSGAVIANYQYRNFIMGNSSESPDATTIIVNFGHDLARVLNSRKK
jgi:hypothetical protein